MNKVTGVMEDLSCPNFPRSRHKVMTIGLTLAGIVAVLIIVGAVFNQTSGEHQVNQPSTQSMADDNTKVQ